MRRILTFLTVLVVIASVPHSAATRSRPVESIYIGSVDGGLDTGRFRELLKDALEAAGLHVTETSEAADAVLSGRVSPWGESNGMFKAFLSDRDGRILWGRSVPRPIRTHKTHCETRDTDTALAQNLAKAVRSAKIRSVSRE
jgi:hypothetical protein